MDKESGLKGYWSLGLSNSCGVGILLRDPDKFKHCTFRCDVAERIISLDCTFNSQDLRFINIVREQIASFWEHWKDRKSDFGNVAEWWDSGMLRVKYLFLKYSHKESRKRKQGG